MGRFTFQIMKREEREEVLPNLFFILHTNMARIAPSECSYEEDQKQWLTYIVPALEREDTKILLMYAGAELAGYFQYRIEGKTIAVEEVEIRPEYQRTMLFYRLCQFMLEHIPEKVQYLTSYVHKENYNSLSIHERLGMVRIGENKSGTSWHYRGNREVLEDRLPVKKQ